MITIPVYKHGKKLSEWKVVDRKPASVTLSAGEGTMHHSEHRFSLRDGTCSTWGLHIDVHEALQLMGRGALRPLKPRKVRPKTVKKSKWKQMGFGWE